MCRKILNFYFKLIINSITKLKEKHIKNLVSGNQPYLNGYRKLINFILLLTQYIIRYYHKILENKHYPN